MPRPAVARLSLAIAVTSTIFALIHPGTAGAAGPGAWTPHVNWASAGTDSYAVHLMLMPGNGVRYHSRILWFKGVALPAQTLKGSLWGWQPGNDGCGSYPSSSFTAIAQPGTDVDLFCAGHSQLADGRILVPGGTSTITGNYGENRARILTLGADTLAGTWSQIGPMSEWRWYPASTPMRDGRALVTAGFQDRQHRIFGGRIGGATPSTPSGDTLHRFRPVEGGAWRPTLRPGADLNLGTRPEPREDHSGVDMTAISNVAGQIVFGGKRGDGQLMNDVWSLVRDDSVSGADYAYRWEKKSPAGVSPLPRRDHTAVVAMGNSMIVFGGDRGAAGLDTAVYRLSNPNAVLQWDKLFTSPVAPLTGPPSGRLGHAAVVNEMNIVEGGVSKDVQRMIVFGGSSSDAAAATDLRVYELRLNPTNPDSATWRVIPETTLVVGGVTQPKPGPRIGHAMAIEPPGARLKQLTGGGTFANMAYMFGGRIGTSTYSDTLWMLWLFESGKYGWMPRATTGARPSGRANHTMVYDSQQGEFNGPRLYVFGGDSSSVLRDEHVYVIDPYSFSDGEWKKWAREPLATTRHVSMLERYETHARVAEIYDPVANTWTALPSATLLERSYPVTFAVSGGSTAGGRVVSASAADELTRYLDLPGPGGTTGSWQPFPNAALGFDAEGGVLYRPNKLMIGGGAEDTPEGTKVVGTTKTLDVLNTANSWVTSGSMIPRFFHNLVQLPDGTVLATGGSRSLVDYNSYPVKKPQIWDPSANGGLGAWSDSTALAVDPLIRAYHSTAILLPDGRVLCSGGQGKTEHDPFADQFKANIFCPPYLFNENGTLAARPQVKRAPRSLHYGQSFGICTDSSKVQSLALLRPAATTHGFDQNQRYVPLSFAWAESTGTERAIQVTAPSDSSIAPPGEYLLFAINAQGTPSVASWVRLGGKYPLAEVGKVTVLQAFCRYAETPMIRFQRPRFANTTLCDGKAVEYDIRYSTQSMNAADSIAKYAAATRVTDCDTPGPDPGPGVMEYCALPPLTANTTYYVRMRVKADAGGHWSVFSEQLSFVATNQSCGGGGSGGGGCCYEGEVVAGGDGTTSASRTSAEASSEYVENSLLPGRDENSPEVDRLWLPYGPREEGGSLRVRLRHEGPGSSAYTAVRLVAVDRAPALRTFALAGGTLAGEPSAATSVRTPAGSELASTLAAGEPFAGDAGDTLEVSTAGASALWLATSGLGDGEQSGIEVQLRVDGQWTTVDWVRPRAETGESAVDGVSGTTARLVFHGPHRLHGAGPLAVGSAAPVSTTLSPTAVRHSRLGTLDPAAAVTLADGDSAWADFAPLAATAGRERDWFLEVTGAPISGGRAAQAMRSVPSSPAALRFALGQNRPNPFTGATVIAFTVPSASDVRLEVFDLLGRRVATLAKRRFEAGRHVVEWDGRHASGIAAPSGVYLYRLRAGGFRAERKLVRN